MRAKNLGPLSTWSKVRIPNLVDEKCRVGRDYIFCEHSGFAVTIIGVLIVSKKIIGVLKK
jgi:hypothetical protein